MSMFFTSWKTKYTEEQRKEIRTSIIVGRPMVLSSFIFLGTTSFLVLLTDIIPPLSGKTRVTDLVDFPSRLQFLCRFLVLHASWFLVNMLYVISFRFPTPAINPMAGNEHLTVAANKIFANSIEQSLISIFTQLSLITFAEPSTIIRLIPLLNFYFVIGRVAFLLGYPRRRPFGFYVNAVPMLFVNAYTLFRFIVYML